MNAAELQQKCLALESELRDRESELATLRELAQDLSQDVQAAKIIELSKKNRALNLALERERQRSAKLQADLSAGGGSSGRPASSSGAAAAPNVEAIEEVARSMVEKAAEAAEAAQREAAQWKDKLSQTTNKISQLEQKVFTLESENKKLTRALVREVGEDVPLAKVLDDSGSSEWKGRREQIIALRDQVKQLRAAAGQAPAETKQEAAAKGVINKIAKERNQEMDRLTSELVAVRGELDALKLKYDGAMSRRKILEAELSSVKAKVAVVLEKTQMDDRLIAALKAEVAALRKGGGGGGAQGAGAGAAGSAERPGPASVGRAGARCTSATTAHDDEELWRELGSLRRRVAEQEEQIDRQEAIILALQQRASVASTPTAGAGRPGSGSRPGSGGQMGGGGRSAQWDGATEQQLRLLEVENSRLTELVALLQRKLEGM
ncbi:Coiled-coil domain-containing protein 13 [Pleodorina starrii]|uniref:Coiled-coil domain-containing protein 13 n=1 Tax=Pleodorina starrii TaxID=330485 RepID=A0A9W6BGP6_9CHLO|nr:Coiled-coil domain-containing protein 13 [Pleodorina starrii]GLC51307.1 Coiled-coil domain-containing protein 13 [Pleodorina starrii]